MNITDISYKVDSIVDRLQASLDKEQVEEVFVTYEIDDPEERIKLLRKCMQVMVFENVEDDISLEDAYNDELEIFVEGSWRLLI
jgi:hypothetical protein